MGGFRSTVSVCVNGQTTKKREFLALRPKFFRESVP